MKVGSGSTGPMRSTNKKTFGLNPKQLQVALVTLAALIAISVLGLTIAKESAVPTVPDLTSEQKKAEGVVLQYEEAVRKKNAKKAWGLLGDGMKKGAKYSIFEKGIKDFPSSFKKYELQSKTTDVLVNTDLATEYKNYLNKDLMQKSWVVTMLYPDVSKSSEDRVKTFVLVPVKDSFKIYSIE